MLNKNCNFGSLNIWKKLIFANYIYISIVLKILQPKNIFMENNNKIDSIWLYIIWKMLNINIPRQNIKNDCGPFMSVNYYFRNEKSNIYIDDFYDINYENKTYIYISYLIPLIKKSIIKDLYIYIEKGYNEEESDPELVIKVDKEFLNKYNFIIPINKWVNIKEKEYFSFLKGKYSFKENQILNNLPVSSHLPDYNIYYWYRLNKNKSLLYINKYLFEAKKY